MIRNALLCSLVFVVDGAALAEQIAPDKQTDGATLENATTATTTAKANVVVVTASAAERDPRLNDTASKTVMSHDEITKYGDSNALDVLKRAPGVVVVRGFPTMRGLGAGYVQVLVNGERPPPGFSLENLNTAQIERIELLRAVSAEFSTAAMAGTINIVLRQAVTSAHRDLVLRMAPVHAARFAGPSLQIADKRGALSWVITGDVALSQASSDYLSENVVPADAATGSPGYDRSNKYASTTRNKLATLTSRWNWKIDNNSQVNLQTYLQRTALQRSSAFDSLRALGTAPLFLGGDTLEHEGGTSGQIELNWITRIAGGRVDARAALTSATKSADSEALAFGGPNLRTLREDEDDRTARTSSNGKYTRSVLDGHALALGWTISQDRDDANRRDVDANNFQGPTFNLDEHYRTDVDRAAFYVQDEWNVTKKWSMYLGIRRERIQTLSTLSGTSAYHTESDNAVLTPIAQTLIKLDKPGRQLRLALTRSFKPPQTAQLTSRYLSTIENDRERPDRAGNPDLVPELASGLDVTYEDFWRADSLFSVSAGGRRISNVIHDVVSQDAAGRWLSRPENDGDARSFSLEGELKLPLRAVWKSLPNIELRTYVNRNWSSVDALHGPGNRLARQIPLSATWNVDYLGGAWNAGAVFVFTKGQLVHTHVDQWTLLQYGRDLDLHLGYTISPTAKWKMDVRNALGEDTFTERLYLGSGGMGHQRGAQRRGPTASLALELKL